MKWLFSKMLPGASRRHERLMGDRKRILFADLAGTVVELGPGTGPNFRYYPRTVRWIGVEPNGYFSPALAEASRGFDAAVLALRAEALPLADASADAVVCTLVLCSVADPRRVLAEALRILKPGGRFYFVEHVGAARGSGLRLVQALLGPVWRLLADGCRTCRDTEGDLRSAGFGTVELEAFSLPLGPVSPHIAGVAVKRLDRSGLAA